MFPIPGAEDVPNTGYGLEQIEGLSIVVLGGFQAVEFEVFEQFIVIGDECQIDCESLLHRRLVEALGHSGAVGFVGDVLADLGQGVLALGMLHVR